MAFVLWTLHEEAAAARVAGAVGSREVGARNAGLTVSGKVAIAGLAVEVAFATGMGIGGSLVEVGSKGGQDRN